MPTIQLHPTKKETPPLSEKKEKVKSQEQKTPNPPKQEALPQVQPDKIKIPMQEVNKPVMREEVRPNQPRFEFKEMPAKPKPLGKPTLISLAAHIS